MNEPRRVRVQGDIFHGKVPDRTVYVGRAASGAPASKFANPFRPKQRLCRAHRLRPYLDAAVIEVTGIDVERLARPTRGGPGEARQTLLALLPRRLSLWLVQAVAELDPAAEEQAQLRQTLLARLSRETGPEQARWLTD